MFQDASVSLGANGLPLLEEGKKSFFCLKHLKTCHTKYHHNGKIYEENQKITYNKFFKQKKTFFSSYPPPGEKERQGMYVSKLESVNWDLILILGKHLKSLFFFQTYKPCKLGNDFNSLEGKKHIVADSVFNNFLKIEYISKLLKYVCL